MIRDINMESVSNKLGGKYEENKIRIKLFNNEYIVSSEEIIDSSGQKPSQDICVILSKYLLLCPEKQPNDHGWVSYSDFKDSAPLVNYFKSEVEEAVGALFSGKLRSLREASAVLGGYLPCLSVSYDFAIQFDSLPKVPVILLYNDLDEEFPAKCLILFKSHCEKYLDCECIAMLGRRLYTQLKNVLNNTT